MKRAIVTNIIFLDGFSVGWTFCLPESFKLALDIKYQNRIFRRKPYFIQTQGSSFSFKEGDVLYDHIDAYKKNWEQALKKIRVMVEVFEIQSLGKTNNIRLRISKIVNQKSIRKYKDVDLSQEEAVYFLQTGNVITENGIQNIYRKCLE